MNEIVLGIMARAVGTVFLLLAAYGGWAIVRDVRNALRRLGVIS